LQGAGGDLNQAIFGDGSAAVVACVVFGNDERKLWTIPRPPPLDSQEDLKQLLKKCLAPAVRARVAASVASGCGKTSQSTSSSPALLTQIPILSPGAE